MGVLSFCSIYPVKKTIELPKRSDNLVCIRELDVFVSYFWVRFASPVASPIFFLASSAKTERD